MSQCYVNDYLDLHPAPTSRLENAAVREGLVKCPGNLAAVEATKESDARVADFPKTHTDVATPAVAERERSGRARRSDPCGEALWEVENDAGGARPAHARTLGVDFDKKIPKS